MPLFWLGAFEEARQSLHWSWFLLALFDVAQFQRSFGWVQVRTCLWVVVFLELMKLAPAQRSDHFRVDEASTSTTFRPNVDRLLTSAKPGRPASLFQAQRWIARWETPVVCFLVHCSQPCVQISVNQNTLGLSLYGKAKRTNPLVNPNILIDDCLLLLLQFIFHGLCWNFDSLVNNVCWPLGRLKRKIICWLFTSAFLLLVCFVFFVFFGVSCCDLGKQESLISRTDQVFHWSRNPGWRLSISKCVQL